MSVTVRPNGRGHEVDIRWRSADGQYHRDRKRLSITSKSAAQRWGELREQQLIREAANPPARPRREVPTLRQFAERFMNEHAVANQLKPSGIDHKQGVLRNHLLPLLGDRRLDEIRNQNVQQLKFALREKKAKTVNNVLTLLGTMLKKAVEWGVLEAMPSRVTLLKNPPGHTRFLDYQQYDTLVASARQHSSRAELVVLLGGDAGLRAGEMRALTWDDVDFSRRQLAIRNSEWRGHITSPKGNRVRYVPMTKRLAMAITRYRHLRGPRVLYRDDGTSFAAHHLEDLLTAAARVAGVRCTPHVLRHTFCSHLAMEGVPIKVIQELAGHQDLKTVERYVHLLPGATHDGIRQLEAARRARVGEIRATQSVRSRSRGNGSS
jgi:integrase